MEPDATAQPAHIRKTPWPPARGSIGVVPCVFAGNPCADSEPFRQQMFTTGEYAWTKKNTLGTYLVSATSSHYLWARKEIRKGFRQKAVQETINSG